MVNAVPNSSASSTTAVATCAASARRSKLWAQRSALVTQAAQLDTLDAVVVPGVGAFGDCAAKLTQVRPLGAAERMVAGRASLSWNLPRLPAPLRIQRRVPGLQGAGSSSRYVVRFAGKGLKVPHIGWNHAVETLRGPIYETLPYHPYFYFVHSYFPVPARRASVSARCDYGGRSPPACSSGTCTPRNSTRRRASPPVLRS